MRYFVSHLQFCLLVILLFVASACASIHVLSQINQFDEIPNFTLPKLASPETSVELRKLNSPAVLIFGEPYNERTLKSLTELKKAYGSVGLTEADLKVFLIISQAPDQEQMAQLYGEGKIKTEILLDKDLKVFGDCGIVVVPSTIVVDKQGRVDLAVSGLPLSYADMITNAILLATDRITPQQYESLGSPMQKTDTQRESVTRAHRLVNLAGELVKRGYIVLALERYREALKIDENYLPARIGAARCLVKLNLLLDAMDELQGILEIDSDHVEANLIIAQVEIMRGGDDIEEGKAKLQRLLALNPDHPEANYLMGMACESQGQVDHAMGYYKKAAMRLLETVMN